MRLLLTVLSLSLAYTINAQDHYHFRGGAAVPLGKYGAKELNEGGYANTGYNFTFENKTFLNDNLSVGFYISYIQNSIDTDQLNTDSFAGNPFILSSTIEADPYKSLLVMVGPQYTFPIGYDAGFSIKGGIGAFTSFYGPLSLNAIVRDPNTGASAPVVEKFSVQGNLAFSFYLGADFHYFLTDSFGLTAFVDYSLANPNFEIESISGLSSESNQQIQFLNIGAGIVFKR